MPRRRLFQTAVFYLTAFFQGICQITLPAASVILKSARYNGLTDQQYGLTFLPLILMTILSTLYFPSLLHRFGRLKIFFAGILFDLMYLSLAAAAGKMSSPGPSFAVLLAANFFLGTGFGLVISVLNVLLSELYPRHCDAALSGLHGFLGAGCCASPLIVNAFHRTGHWSNMTGAVAAGLGIAACLAVLGNVFRGFPANRRDKHAGEVFGIPKATPLMIVLVLSSLFIYGIAESIVGNWAPVYLQQEKGLTLESGAVCLALFWGFVTAGRLATAVAAMRMNSRFFLRIAPAVLILGFILVMRIRGAGDVPLAFVVAGLGCSCVFPVAVSLGIRAHPQWRDALSGFGVGALMGGVLVGSTFTGILRQLKVLSLHQVFGAGILFSAVLFVLCWLISRDHEDLKLRA
ncbi:MAG: MFS transporter [Candidatus Omnitrophota bacterium]|jgi:fucose permease